MKKLLAFTLILVLCLSVVLVACNNKKDDGNTLKAPAEYLEKVRDALDTMTDVKAETIADITVTKSVPYQGIYAYPTTWTVDNDKIKLIDQGTTILVQVPKRYAGETFEFTLTATITADDGTTIVVKKTSKIPQFKVATYEEYLAACKANDSSKSYNVVGYVVAVNADPDSSSKGSLWIMDKNGNGYYAYKPKLDASITASRESINKEFPYGTEVAVSGALTLYNGAYEFAKDCTIAKTGNTAAKDNVTFKHEDRTAAFAASTDSKHEDLVKYQATLAKLDGIRMGAIDNLNLHFTLGGQDYVCYNNVYLMDKDTMEQFKAKWIPGGKANVRGVVNVFNGVYQIYPQGLDSLEIVAETDAEKVAGFKNVLTLDDKYSRDFTLPSSTLVNVSWTVTGTAATIGTDGFSVTLNQTNADQKVTFTATIKSGDVTDTWTKEVTVSKFLPKWENKVEGATIKTFEQLAEEGPKKKGDPDSTEKFYTMGYVSKIDNSSFGNLYIVDKDGNEFYIYGTYNYNGTVRYDKMDASEKPVVDSLVVVYGVLSYYNSLQMKNACVLQLNDKVLLPTDEEAVARDVEAIKKAGLKESYYEQFNLTVDGINGSKITWTTTTENVVIGEDGSVTFEKIAAPTDVTFTGTVKKGNKTGTVTLTTKLIAPSTEYSVTYSAGTNGTIKSVKAGDKDVESGSKVKVGTVLTFTVEPATDYQLMSYTVGTNEPVTTVAGKTSFELTVVEDTTLTITFAKEASAEPALTIKNNDLKVLDATTKKLYNKYAGDQTIGSYTVNVKDVAANTYNDFNVVQIKGGTGTIKTTGTFSKIKIVYYGANNYSDGYGLKITVGGKDVQIDAASVNATKVDTGKVGVKNQDEGKAIYQFTIEVLFESTTGEVVINNINGAKYCASIELY